MVFTISLDDLEEGFLEMHMDEQRAIRNAIKNNWAEKEFYFVPVVNMLTDVISSGIIEGVDYFKVTLEDIDYHYITLKTV